MNKQLKQIYEDLLLEDLSKITVKQDIYSIEIIFPDVHIEIEKDMFYRTNIKIKLPMREPFIGKDGTRVTSPFVTKFTFSVFGRKLYNRAKKIIKSKIEEEKKVAISKTLEILEK